MWTHSQRYVRLLVGAAVVVAVQGQSAFSQDEQAFDLSGVNFWEATIDGFDAQGEQDGTSISFEVTGRLGDAAERRIFSFVAQDKGEDVTLLLETTGLDTAINAVTIVSQSGAETVIPVEPLERIAIEVASAQQRWCNPFVGCRFEFWRRRGAVEQSFTFASPVDVTIEAREFEARKLLFESEELEAYTPEFSSVTIVSNTSVPTRVLDITTQMPPMIHDGLFHHLRGDAGATTEAGVLRVSPFEAADRFELAVDSGATFTAWHGRVSLSAGGGAADQRSGAISMQAEVRFGDGSMVPIAFLDAEVVDRASDRQLRLGAGFDTDTYRFVALNGHNVVTDLSGLVAGQVAVILDDIDWCETFPDFFEGCPRFGFKVLPQQSDACAWVLELAVPLRAQVFGADGTASEVSADTFLLLEDRGDVDAGHDDEGEMVFSRITIRGTGIETLGLFDQSIAPAHPRPGRAH